VFLRRSKRTRCSDDRLSLSLSLFLRFNLNAQICDGYNGARLTRLGRRREKEVFGAKREKRGDALLCEKETRLQLKSFVKTRAISLSLSLSLSFSHFFSLSFNCLFCSFIRLIREHDVQWKLTPSTRASINALLASSSTTK
jgi:hypothetical protein